MTVFSEHALIAFSDFSELHLQMTDFSEAEKKNISNSKNNKQKDFDCFPLIITFSDDSFQ